jgi:hypothetical protein
MGAVLRGQGGGLALALLILLAAGAADAERIVFEELGDGPVPVPGVGNAGLSGITWLEGGRFLAVDDDSDRMYPLQLTLDESTGGILQVEVGAPIELEGAKDAEGIAKRHGAGSVLVADEGTHDVREHDVATGKRLRVIPPPAFYKGRIKNNKGFEGVTIASDGSVWIATESPLRRDGLGPDSTSGGWIRLQRFDASFAPAEQYAYLPEPGFGFVGVVDLLATPEGELLVLERALTGGGFTARVFQVDASRATDVASIEKLRNRDDVRAVQKQKLWERSGGFQNFEGIALGPSLASGGRLVLLISDGGGHRAPHLLALRLTRKAAEAASSAAPRTP